MHAFSKHFWMHLFLNKSLDVHAFLTFMFFGHMVLFKMFLDMFLNVYVFDTFLETCYFNLLLNAYAFFNVHF